MTGWLERTGLAAALVVGGGSAAAQTTPPQLPPPAAPGAADPLARGASDRDADGQEAAGQIGSQAVGQATVGQQAGGGAGPFDRATSAPDAAAPPAADAAEAEAETTEEVVVTGSRRLPGSVVGDIPPEVVLSPADIRSYGVNSVAELLTELAPQTGSGRGGGGAPVVLLNGRRISGFQEIRDLPTEAIQRVDILPEEVALKYGYRADQRVVNFVLRRRFRAATAEGSDRFATEGGRNTAQGELDLLRLQRDTRANLHLSYTGSDALLESDRGILPPAGVAPLEGRVLGADGVLLSGVPAAAAAGPAPLAQFLAAPAGALDPTPFRTLQGSSDAFGANATYARQLGAVSASVNGRLDLTRNRSLNGLPALSLALPADNPFQPFGRPVTVQRSVLAGPLEQRNRSATAHLGTAFNGGIGRWNWSLTGAYDRVRSNTLTELGLDTASLRARLLAGEAGLNPFGDLLGATGAFAVNRGRSTSQVAQADALAFGRVFDLPAGAVNASLKAGLETNSLDSRSLRGGLETPGQEILGRVRRDTANGQANIDLPITRRDGFGGAVGQLSANLNLGVDELSDFGTLTTVGYGFNWSPFRAVRLIGSVTNQEQAPSAAQLGNPVITTPGVRVFDFVTGTTAVVTTVTGGNPGLSAEDRRARKLGLTIRPWEAGNLSLTADYTDQRVDGAVAGFPAITAAIQAAFPNRFERDGAGNLLRLDSRPINFARTERSQLRWGFNLSLPLRSALQRRIAAWRSGQGPNPFGAGGPGGAGRGRQREAGQGEAGQREAGQGQAGAPQDGTDRNAPNQGGPESAQGSGGGRGLGGFGGGGFAGGGGRGGFGGGPGGGGPGGGGGRLQFALYHEWRFTERVTVADGGPVLDLLNGDTTGSRGGTPRHRFEAQAGYSNNGLGVRLSGDYQSGTRVTGGTAATPNPLRFGDLATLDLRVFLDAAQRPDLTRDLPWLRGARVSLSVDNLFNRRQRVTDAAGLTPIGLQPAYLDPLGRSVRLSVRKLFF